jgi:hypothetical protein
MPGRRQKTHLRRQLTGLLAAVGKIGRQIAVEVYHGFAQREAHIRAAQAENVHSCFPR